MRQWYVQNISYEGIRNVHIKGPVLIGQHGVHTTGEFWPGVTRRYEVLLVDDVVTVDIGPDGIAALEEDPCVTAILQAQTCLRIHRYIGRAGEYAFIIVQLVGERCFTQAIDEGDA